MKLDGLAVGTLISQFYGPWTGTNYGGSGTPVCLVSLRSIGSSGAAVKIQYNITPTYGYDGSGSLMPLPNPANWVDVATVNTEGLTSTNITTRASIHWLRVIVSTVGSGYCDVGGLWAKR